jgi:hypothetical protein
MTAVVACRDVRSAIRPGDLVGFSAGTQESQFACAIAEGRHRLSPQDLGFDVRTLVAAQVVGSRDAQSPLVRHHGVVPCSEPFG